MIHTAKELQETVKITNTKVGVILALPKNSEGKKVSENAYNVLNQAFELVDEGLVSPLIIVDPAIILYVLSMSSSMLRMMHRPVRAVIDTGSRIKPAPVL